MEEIAPTQIASMGFDAVYLSSRSPPTAPDGYYDWQITTDPADKREGHAAVTNLIHRVEAFKGKGGIKHDPSLIDAFTDAVTHPVSVDDRKGVFAAGLGMLARLDPYSDVTKKLNNAVIGTLYNTVPHPPASYLGPATSFRQADGGGNNLQDPDVGRGGTPYSRSVQGKAALPRHSLPDPGLIFDTILKKRDHQNHAGGMSSMIFAFASIVTHSLFRTDPNNMNINNASSYLDLSPLYGDNQAAQDKVRDKSAGLGLLYPDTFSEERLLFAPPATSALLVIFSRNHNYIAQRLLKINEWKRWADPPPTDFTARSVQDEEIFQTAKLINCGHFMSAVMGDYVAGFLGSSEGCNWNMNAFDVIDTKDLEVPRGLGNHSSAEFNILYRWHATISEQDQKWTENVFRSAFGGKPFDKLNMSDIGSISSLFEEISLPPSRRVFAGLSRGEDGKFSDDDLADVLQCATENPAGAFRGQGTPEVLRIAEIAGIEQARKWGLCTMNEFRKFLGLREFETFEEWNPDPAIAGAARQLYGHVNNLELYTGLQAESTMPLTDGSRFACGYTTTRGVLGDAIALVRGDRYYTSDFTPANLTAWGFQDCQRDMNNGGYGGQIPKLLIRHLPRHYPFNSVYSLFPFFVPSKMKATLTKQGLSGKYTFDRPLALPIPKILNTFTGIKHVFSDPSRFKIMYERYGYGSFMMFDEVAQHDADKAMVLHALFPNKESLSEYAAWYSMTTAKHIKEKSWKYDGVDGTYFDVTYVINAVSAHLSAEKLCGISIKTKENPSGIFTEQELFDLLSCLFT
ncbi:Psi-producing oxygenase A [Hypsizygus marmoreus]|uniref:Psi-producing oxygenase A n=1 Tax=Hypsizygus marmoreus TaxID=39966 RepID=A0A369JBX3_HYPMA|nr:Psi-producing oxygenase A [Hypsizygus marmoreus]